MAEQTNITTQLSLEELASQLRKPTGEEGKQVGLLMNKGNQHICLNTYKVLNPVEGSHILEIGMGNGFFIKDLLSMADGLSYIGVDFSSEMVKEASASNKAFIDEGKVKFEEASIDNLPFSDSQFDYISTTNTLYFWADATKALEELFRVMKPEGKLVIAYRPNVVIRQLGMYEHGFTEYISSEVEELLKNAGFTDVETKEIAEPPFELDGKVIEMGGLYTFGVKL